jgi:ubiquinone/menaquinone biosynthesis C-methylase UbiE
LVRPETIENQWDIFYRDYPEVYEEFSRVRRTPSFDLTQIFGVKGKIVVDVGAGTGRSTFALASTAQKVIGIEPETAMLKLARQNLKHIGFSNVVFRKGTAERIPLPDKSADIVAAVTVASFCSVENITRFVQEAERVLAKGGYIYSIDIADGWYGGELAPVIYGRSRRPTGINYEQVRADAFTSLGFKRRFFYQWQYYDSVKHIVSTYGFIFGKKAIEYLKAKKKTSIKWKTVLHYKQV